MSPTFGQRYARKSNEIACIFVHAGAGYHSEQNEHIHLKACEDAASLGMKILRARGTALDAVETAIKVLEDREITNAGYGSNLSLDGVVECDAVVVDHYGRSGACGAVAQIKNPISLARLILDRSTKTLSLRRVPPNLLVGQGATDFAQETGMDLVSYESLISKTAQERWTKWKQDLFSVKCKGESHLPSAVPVPAFERGDQLFAARHAAEEKVRQDHTRQMEISAFADRRTPSSKTLDLLSGSSTSNSKHASVSSASTNRHSSISSAADLHDPSGTTSGHHDKLRYSASHAASLDALSTLVTANDHVRAVTAPHVDTEMSDVDDEDDTPQVAIRPMSHWGDGSADDGSAGSDTDSTMTSLRLPSITPSPPPSQSPKLDGSPERDDLITDTVGVIAIDIYGNIACGASSGGIGMKHRGRMGPAALVGVGAAVVPQDDEDREQASVAVVTSGTGEHMATTTAASTFAERLYSGIRKGRGGRFVECDNDDEAVKSVIEKEFMRHPSVVHSNSSGAIGVLCVKKTKAGINLHFAHNTDSFALASQHYGDEKPSCTMSRKLGSAPIAWGGSSRRTARKHKPSSLLP